MSKLRSSASKNADKAKQAKPTISVPAHLPDVRGTSNAKHPWVVGRIDYGPAIAAVHDLAAWAFDLAARDVDDWPESRRRVKNARRFVLGRLRGKDVTRVPYEDVLFTAGLLARIFEEDLRLPMAHIVAALDKLGLPTEVVPLMPRRQARAGAVYPLAPITPITPRPQGGIAVAPKPPGYCDACGVVHGAHSALRFAA